MVTDASKNIVNLIREKEFELREIQEVRCKQLEQTIIDREKLLQEHIDIIDNLRIDYEYNLKLLDARDQEIQRLSTIVNDTNSQLQHMKDDCDIIRQRLEDHTRIDIQRIQKEEIEKEQTKGKYKELIYEIEKMHTRMMDEKQTYENIIIHLKQELEATIQDKKITLEQQRNELTQSYETMLQKRDNMTASQNKIIQEQLLHLESRLDILRTENMKLSTELSSSQREVGHTEELVRERTEMMRSLQWQLEDTRVKAYQNEQEYTRKYEQWKEEKEMIQLQYEDKLKDMQLKIDQYMNEVQQERSHRETLESSYSELQKLLQINNTKYTHAMNEEIKQRQSLQQSYYTLNEAYQQVISDKNIYENKVITLQQDMNILQQEYTVVHEKYTSSRTELDEVNKVVQVQQKDIEVKDQTLEEWISKYEQLIIKFTHLKEENDAYNTTQNMKIDEYKQQIETLIEENTQLKTSNTDLLNDKNRLEERVKELELQYIQYQLNQDNIRIDTASTLDIGKVEEIDLKKATNKKPMNVTINTDLYEDRYTPMKSTVYPPPAPDNSVNEENNNHGNTDLTREYREINEDLLPVSIPTTPVSLFNTTYPPKTLTLAPSPLGGMNTYNKQSYVPQHSYQQQQQQQQQQMLSYQQSPSSRLSGINSVDDVHVHGTESHPASLNTANKYPTYVHTHPNHSDIRGLDEEIEDDRSAVQDVTDHDYYAHAAGTYDNLHTQEDDNENVKRLLRERNQLRLIIKEMRVDMEVLQNRLLTQPSSSAAGPGAEMTQKNQIIQQYEQELQKLKERLEMSTSEINRLRQNRRQLIDISNELRAQLRTYESAEKGKSSSSLSSTNDMKTTQKIIHVDNLNDDRVHTSSKENNYNERNDDKDEKGEFDPSVTDFKSNIQSSSSSSLSTTKQLSLLKSATNKYQNLSYKSIGPTSTTKVVTNDGYVATIGKKKIMNYARPPRDSEVQYT